MFKKSECKKCGEMYYTTKDPICPSCVDEIDEIILWNVFFGALLSPIPFAPFFNGQPAFGLGKTILIGGLFACGAIAVGYAIRFLIMRKYTKE